MEHTFLSQLGWRFATKKFDTQKKIDQQTLDQILYAIQMTPTSLGLQTIHTYVISDQKIKEAIEASAYGQEQVSTCSHLLVFCCRTDVVKRVEQYATQVREKQIVSPEKAVSMEAMMKRFVGRKSAQEVLDWSAKQSYIALGFALAACAELQVDSCPMEGFNAQSVDEILNLPEEMKSITLLPIGYRAEGPSRKKVRFSKEDLFSFIE